jgi:hypothetical protein
MHRSAYREKSLFRTVASRRALAGGVIAIAVCLGGCVGTNGQGAVTTEMRQAQQFTDVEVGNGIGLALRIGDAKPLEVRAQKNILPLIATEVVDGKLRIHSTAGYTTSQGVQVTIVTPTLEAITLSGGSKGTIDGLTAESLAISMSGGSGLTANGSVGVASLSLTGGSRGDLETVSAREVTVDVSGGSNVTITATDEVNGSASGGSHVTVVGNATLNVQSSGGAEVTHR